MRSDLTASSMWRARSRSPAMARSIWACSALHSASWCAPWPRPFGIGDIGGPRLFYEDMGAGLHRADRMIGMAVGIGGDHDKVGSGLHPRFEALEPGVTGKRFGQVHAGAVHEAHDL